MAQVLIKEIFTRKRDSLYLFLLLRARREFESRRAVSTATQMQRCANCVGYGCRSALCPRGELCEGQCLEKMGAEITFAGGVNSVLQANSASHSYNLTTGDYASRQQQPAVLAYYFAGRKSD